MNMTWHVLTLSWSQVRKQHHLKLAELAESKVRRAADGGVEEARMKSQMITGGRMRLYLSPGVMKCAGERMIEEGAKACEEPPPYFPTTFAAA